MNKKIAFVAVLSILLPALALPSMADAQVRTEPTGAGEESITAAEAKMMPYWYDENDWPSLLVMKGIAAKDNKLASAVFVVVNDDGEFSRATIIVDGKSRDIEISGINRYPKNGAIVVSFDGGSLLLKRYQINYMDTLLVSGSYDGWQLNMRLVGNEPIYRIFEQPAEIAQSATEMHKLAE